MKVKSIVLLISILMLSGCAIKQPYELYENQFVQNTNKGILICSIIHAKYGLIRPVPSYYIRRIGSDEPIRIYGRNSLSQAFLGTSEVSDDGPGVIKILELPEGDYEIFQWKLFFNLGMSQWYESPENDISIPFKVQADSINYIGQLTLDNYQLYVEDQSERDIEEAYNRNASLQGLPITKHYLECISEYESEIKESDTVIHTPQPVPVK